MSPLGKVTSNILYCPGHSEQFTFCCWWTTLPPHPHNALDLVEAEEVGVRLVGQLPGMGHVHVHPVMFLQLHGGAQVTLRGPGVTRPQGAETLPVALHQDLG